MANSAAYYKIEKAIAFINSRNGKSLHYDEIAKSCGLNLAEFSELLKNWCGTDIQHFVNLLKPALNRKSLEKSTQTDLFESNEIQYGRAFDDYVNIIQMSGEEFGDKGSGLKINYEFYDTQFGEIIVASTDRGVCYIAFENEKEQALRNLKSRFFNAEFTKAKDDFQETARAAFKTDTEKTAVLHLHGSDFQQLVWRELLKIPMGKLMSYHQIADALNMPSASRAVGTAIGRNPVAYLVPCHRVIQSDGGFGGYMWGSDRKMAIKVWETSLVKY